MPLLAILALFACRSDPRCPEEGAAIACDGSTLLTCSDGKVEAETTCDGGGICAVDVGCVTCDLVLPGSLAVPIDRSEVTEPWQTLGWRAVTLGSGGRGALTIDGPFEVTDADASPIEFVDLPGTVWIRALSGGTGTLTVEVEGCSDPATVQLEGLVDPGLSVTPRAAGAPVSYVDAVPSGGTVRVALDPRRFPERIDDFGLLYLVEDRDREAWLADPTLVDAVAGARQVRVLDAALADNIVEVWPEASAADGTVGRYDIVIDYDEDGVLSPGDRIDGLDGPGVVVMPDLTANGPYTAAVDEVSASFFLTQRVYWPEEIGTFEAPAPLVVISHGNGHEYDWYDFLGEQLASWGYVVMAHRNDTQPGVNAAATTTLTNTDAFVRNHALIDPVLEGNVDTHRIVWIGHSRGGEGILLAHERLRTGSASVQVLQASDIVLLSSIAPTVFEDPEQASPGPVPFHMLTGSADGDVTGGVGSPLVPGPCDLCQWWRLLQGGTSRNHVTYMQGAIHNDFNCCGPNDGIGVNAPKVGRIETNRYMRALYVALLKYELDDEVAFGEYLRRMPDDLGIDHPPEFPVVTQSRMARSGEGVFVEDFQTNTNDPTLSSSGTAVRNTLTGYAEGRLDDGNNQFAAGSDPWNGMTQAHNDGPIAARGAVFEWSGDAEWEVDLPEDARDLTLRRFLAMRVAQATRHPLTESLDDTLAFSVGLVDHTGTEVTLPTAAYGRVSQPYPRPSLGPGQGWANEFNTIRIPLFDFEALGLDLNDVRTIRVRFGPTWGSPEGRIGFDDIALEDR